MYFNEKYKRSGTLFQGRTKRIHIDKEPYFLHILHYIHLNPLDFSQGSSEWRLGKIVSTGAALNYLEQYRWSSYLDYCNTRNFPSILDKTAYAETYPDYRLSLRSYLADMRPSEASELFLE